MYGFVTHTWNTIKGKCPHKCKYCMKCWENQKAVRFDEKELKTDLGVGNTIFVGSTCDMFAEEIDAEWIDKTIFHCEKYPKNHYLFQSKNPVRMIDWIDGTLKKKNVTVATTIETNRLGFNYDAPSILDRAAVMKKTAMKKMVTIEPIMDFDVDQFLELLIAIDPDIIAIGADSGGHKLPEPSPEKVKELVEVLQMGASKIHLKPNLRRIINLTQFKE